MTDRMIRRFTGPLARRVAQCSLLVITTLLMTVPVSADGNGGKVEGTFVLEGKDAKLQHIRAGRAKLDEKGKMGYAVLLSALPAEGDLARWQTADPAEKGSFIFLLLEANGEVWVAELGHEASTSGRFGVVIEVKANPFTVKDGHLTATLRTAREEEFSGNHYTIDLTFDAPLEK